MDIVEALGAEDGVVCFVGAGGKKTAMYAVAERTARAVVTATVRIPIFDEHVLRTIVTSDPVAAIADVEAWPVGIIPEREREDRYFGYNPGTIDELGEAIEEEVVLVKADGARMRRFKAPGEHEPQIPETAETVVAVASAHVVGEPLTEERVHRVERVADLTGRNPGEPIRVEDVVTVLTSEAGGRKGVPDEATYVPLVNMVDDAGLEATAREITAGVHERVDVPRVVLTKLIADNPVIDVVE